MPLLTLPLELRKKIYVCALELSDEFVMCECPEHVRTELGLCDQVKWLGNFTFSKSRCAAVRKIKNPKVSLALLWQHVAEDLKDFSIGLQILVFCKAACCLSMMNDLYGCSWFEPGFLGAHIWAVKIVECTSPAYDIASNLAPLCRPLYSIYVPDFTDETSLKEVSFKDNG